MNVLFVADLLSSTPFLLASNTPQLFLIRVSNSFNIMPKNASVESLASLVEPLYGLIYKHDTSDDASPGTIRLPSSPQQSTHKLRHSHGVVNRLAQETVNMPTTFQLHFSDLQDFHGASDFRGVHDAPYDDCHGTTNSQVNFQHLPRELRDEIYRYVIGDIRQLDIYQVDWLGRLRKDSPRCLLLRRIPPCLLLNHHILNEALEVVPDQVSGIKALSPQDTTTIYPSTKVLRNVRRLEFTYVQPSFSNTGTYLAPQDVALRCSKLEELSILLPATKDAVNNYASDLISIFENKSLVKLTLNYENAPWKGWDNDYALFQPLESWFKNECKKRGRHINFTIDLAPGRVSRSIEEHKARMGCIEYMQCMDIFG